MRLNRSDLLVGVSAFVIFNLIAAPVVLAVSSATITATVTAQNIALTVTDGAVSYGTVALGSSVGTNSSDTQTITNAGNVAEDFTIKGSNSADWILDSANSTQNHYMHKFCVSSCTTPPTSYTALTTNYASLGAGNVSASGTQTFDLYLTTPQSSTIYTSQNVDVTVQAAAH
jgi:hypothetical protein